MFLDFEYNVMWAKIMAIVCCWEYSTLPVGLIVAFMLFVLSSYMQHLCIHTLLFTPPPQRYYGKSLPFGQESFRLDNIGYLSVEHALADFAVLVKEIRQTYKIDKVVSFGGR